MHTMKVTELLDQTDFDNSLLLGYYGGGNYGDELLLEVLGNLLSKRHAKDCVIGHQDPAHYTDYHHDFGYRRFLIHDKKALLRELIKSKHVIVGGGGLWGVDMNFNTFLLSVFLFVSRWVFGKQVHLFGVGFYHSTSRLGRTGGWLAGKAATHIIARDRETYANFRPINRRTYLDSDLAWYIEHLDLSAYESDLAQLEKKIPITGKTICISPRRSQAKHQGGEFKRLNDAVAAWLQANQQTPVIIALLESESKSPDEYALARQWRQDYPNVQLLDGPCNPLTLFLFFQKYRDQLALIGPQFHIIITAHLNGVPFMPIVYDNKVTALLECIGVEAEKRIPLAKVEVQRLQTFTNTFLEGAETV